MNNLIDIVGLPSGTIPEVEDPRFKDWLKESIMKGYRTLISSRDPIITSSYLAEMQLYLHLYAECYDGD